MRLWFAETRRENNLFRCFAFVLSLSESRQKTNEWCVLGETFTNFKLLPQVWQRSHYPNLVLTGFPSDLCERDEAEARLRLITLIEMNQICPFFAEDGHEHEKL